MSTCAFSIDQLMELAGLSVSQAGELNSHPVGSTLGYKLTQLLVYRVQPLQKGRRILVACGPGNNGMLPFRSFYLGGTRLPFLRRLVI